MKKKQFLKTTFLALALAICGASTAWADDYQDFTLDSNHKATLDLSAYTNTLTGDLSWNSTESRIDFTNTQTFTLEYKVNIAEAGYYRFNGTIDWSTNEADRMTITIINDATSATEFVQECDVHGGGNTRACELIYDAWTTGNKTLRLSFVLHHKGYLKNFTFTKIGEKAWPVSGGTTEYLSLQYPTLLGPSKIRVEGNGTSGVGNGWRLGYVNADTYAEYYATNASTNYYSIKLKFYSAPVDNQVKLTITDVATTTTEVEQTFTVTTAGGDQEFTILNKVTSGLKKIRFDFISAFNQLQLVQFAVNSNIMDEAVDYTPVTASDVTVTLKRSIAANAWSTICLPFAMTSAQLKNAFGDNVKVAELTSGDNTTLTFSTVTETAANKPYAIMVSSPFTEATITGVDIVSATPKQTIANWDFVGTYSKTTISEGNYYFKSNQLYKAGTGSHNIKPFRAYLEYTGSGVAPARMLNFIIDGGTTAIGTIKADGTMMTLNESTVYSLSGQRVAKPSKGVYIVNGKKVIFK